MDPLARLLAIEEIKQLKARYFRHMDCKEWGALGTVFTADAVFDARTSLSISGDADEGRAAESNDWIWHGGEAIVEQIRQVTSDIHSVHHGHCHEVEILSDEEARGVIAMQDYIWSADRKVLSMEGCGHYHETYRKVDGAWRIATSRITRLQVILAE